LPLFWHCRSPSACKPLIYKHRKAGMGLALSLATNSLLQKTRPTR